MIISKTNPAKVKVKERHPLTKEGSSKDTFHVSLDLTGSGIQFKVGDSLGIFPQNDPILVDHLIQAMGATGDEEIKDPRNGQLTTLRKFLTHRANLVRVTSNFLKLFYEYEKEHDKKNEIHRLLDNRTRLSEYLSARDPLDLIKEYRDVQAPLQDLCAQFGLLLPRFYSVASSQMSQPNKVDLTVALFTFTHGGEVRYGVASHFLCHLAEIGETEVPIYVQPANGFTLPEDDDASIIMVGPGTGIAPFRAFMQERIHRDAKGKNWLFFGECNQQTDYFYQDYWEKLVSEGKLELDVAFSRDQAEKVYVQHKMLEKSHQIWRWLHEGAYFYVCGDADHMAKDVEATLIKIAEAEGALDYESAKAYIKSLKTQKRYLLDVY